MAKPSANVVAATSALRRVLSAEPRASDPKFGIDQFPPEVWGCVVPLALDQVGCRVLQSAFDEADSGCRAALANELRGNVCKVLDSPHANHVLQRVVELLAPQSVRFILQELSQGQNPAVLARHRFGCRVLERLIEHFPAPWLSEFLQGVLEDTANLCGNQYGTFVMQHILEHGLPAHKRRIAEALLLDVQWAALDPNAVGVLDSALSYAPLEDQKRLATAILECNGLVHSMACSRRGHSAAVRLLRVLEADGAAGPSLAEARRQLMGRGPDGARVKGRRTLALFGTPSSVGPDEEGIDQDDVDAEDAFPRAAGFIQGAGPTPAVWAAPLASRRRGKGRSRAT